MGFAWVTNVGVGANIDAADRNETKTNISTLYTVWLGANWPGNLRFPACLGAGFDVAAPCPVVWDIAVGDDIYQTPGAHPVSELQEARDKLDWAWDNRCVTENAGHDNPVHGAENASTRAAANPTTYGIAQSLEQIITQAVANPNTNAVAQSTEDAITQAIANPGTQFVDDPGCPADCPLDDGVDNTDYTGENTNEYVGEDSTAHPTYNEVYVGAEKGADQDLNQSGDQTDRGSVYASNCGTYLALDDFVVDMAVYQVYQSPHCYGENVAVFNYVDYYDNP